MIVFAGATTAAAQPDESAPSASKTTTSAASPDAGPVTPIFSVGLTPLPISTEPRPVDLFPNTVFGPGALAGGNSGEKESGVRFGDGHWKTHAVQVGGMMAGWAALAALCGGGRCMLPKALTSWMPGTTSEAPPAPARVGPRTEGLPKMR